MASQYALTKRVWSEADFDDMDWHDARIWGMAFLQESFEFVLDIDYILEWLEPLAGETHYRFWAVPATLVFHNCYDVRLELEPYADLSIDAISRDDQGPPRNAAFVGKDTEWSWTIGCHVGHIELRAAGFTQFARGEPTLTSTQFIPLEKRGGVSFQRGAV